MKINIKPLSVNKLYRGRRFKSAEYIQYMKDIALQITDKVDIDVDDKLLLEMEVGFSNKASDLDNSCKGFQDILSEVYGFNDRQIYEIRMYKKVVQKGDEYIDYNLTKI